MTANDNFWLTETSNSTTVLIPYLKIALNSVDATLQLDHQMEINGLKAYVP